MPSDRSLRIFLMAEERQTAHTWGTKLADLLLSEVPNYESTKGSSSFEQELAIRGWQYLENEKKAIETVIKALEYEIQSYSGHELHAENGTKSAVTEEQITKKNGTDSIQLSKIVHLDNLVESKENNLNLENIIVNHTSSLRNAENFTCDIKSSELGLMNVENYEIRCRANDEKNLKNNVSLLTSAEKTSKVKKNLKSNRKYEENIELSGTMEYEITSTVDFENFTGGKRQSSESVGSYDSAPEAKTLGSEYLPSDDDCPNDNNGSDGETSTSKNSSGNSIYCSKTEMDGKSTNNLKIKHHNNFDPNRPSTSGYNLEKKKSIYLSDSEFKINVLSNIQIKPSTRPNDHVSVTEADSISDFPEKTSKSYDDSPRNMSKVKISAAMKTTRGKRIRNKKHSCYYCNEMILHIARHLEVKHTNEIDVARALSYPKKSMKRKELFSEITRAGDFHYNCEVISLNQGELILVRRPTMNEIHFNKYRDYGPCPNCLGFLLKKNLWHHMKVNCSKKVLNNQFQELEPANQHVIAESNAILSNVFGTEFSSDYKKYIVNTLRDDDVGTCCREDNLILKFGGMQFEKYGTTQCELIRQSMRQLARLTMTVREITSQNLKLFDLLRPQKFDLIVQGVKELCRKYQNDSTKRPEFMIPSLALKLGHSLRKCANIERGLALRQENLQRNESLLAFCNVMELEWQIRISSNALSTLYKRHINAGQLLPVTNDLIKSNDYIKAGIKWAQTELTKSPTAESWSYLAKLILCRIILFNKRRAGEASRMTLEQYTMRPSWTEQTIQELKAALTPYEVKLAERHVIVNIIGKRGRIVPVLLTPETKTGIDILISHRSEAVGINSKNPYVFPRGLLTLTHMRGPDVLKKIIGEVEGLEKPDHITSTKLRKYVATVCQIFDLSENEYDWLARHLGHDIRVHREFYRLHEDVVELTKVSRLLMAVDSGEANKFAGKQLRNINLSELPPIEEEDGNENNDEEQEDANCEMDQEASNDTNSPQIQKPIDDSVVKDCCTQNDSKLKSDYRKPFKKGSAKEIERTKWDANDKKAVFEYFRIHIKNGIVPGKTECEACQNKYPRLQSRKWTDIKFCVHNQIKKIKKLKKN